LKFSQSTTHLNLPPLSNHHVLMTMDIDECRTAVSNRYHPISFDVEKNHNHFAFYYNHAFLNGLSISYHYNSEPIYLQSDPPEDSYILQFYITQGSARTTYGKQEAEFSADGGGCLISPFRSCSWLYSADHTQFIVRIKRSLLELQFELLTGTHLREPLEFTYKIDRSNERVAGMRPLVNSMIVDLNNPDSLVHHPAFQTKVEELVVTSVLLAQPHNHSTVLEGTAPSSGPSSVRKAEEYIREYLTEALSIGTIASNVGVSIRSLQAAFKKHRGYSPTQFIKKQRLVQARQGLLIHVEKTVAEIAISLGFNHLGKFSADYRKEFGELPSQTLRRARRLRL